MCPTTSQEWRECEEPARLLQATGPALSNRKRQLIALASLTYLWQFCDGEPWAVRERMEEATGRIGMALGTVCLDGSYESLGTSLAQIEEHLQGQEAQRQEMRELQDWYGEWEVRDRIKLVRMQRDVVRLCRETVMACDAAQVPLAQILAGLPERMAGPFLYRGERPPEQMYPIPPHELPWEIFMHLEGGYNGPSIWSRAVAGTHHLLADYVREIVPDPFCGPPVNSDWITPSAVGLATGMLQTGCFDQMSRLWEVLEEAGCDDSAILSHCLLEPEAHSRGCWLIDAVLGR